MLLLMLNNWYRLILHDRLHHDLLLLLSLMLLLLLPHDYRLLVDHLCLKHHSSQRLVSVYNGVRVFYLPFTNVG